MYYGGGGSWSQLYGGCGSQNFRQFVHRVAVSRKIAICNDLRNFWPEPVLRSLHIGLSAPYVRPGTQTFFLSFNSFESSHFECKCLDLFGNEYLV